MVVTEPVMIEFLRPWMGAYAVGQVVAWDHPGAAGVLFRRGIARPAAAGSTAKPKGPVKKGK